MAYAADGSDHYFLGIIAGMWAVLIGLVALLWANNGKEIKDIKEAQASAARDIMELKLGMGRLQSVTVSEQGTRARANERIMNALEEISRHTVRPRVTAND